MRLQTCPRCGKASSGFMKLCGLCQEQRRIPDADKIKGKKRLIDEPEDDE